MNFIAIDFEIANPKYSSACSLGMTIVEENKIIETKEWLIKPTPFEFNMRNVYIHGITEDDVIDAPTFDQLWQDELKYYFEKYKNVIAHNAAFDVAVLRKTLDEYQIEWPEINYLCTYKIAQHTIPNLFNYRLNTVSKHFGIELDHHNAASDCNACAEIFLRIVNDTYQGDLEKLLIENDITIGSVDKRGYDPCSAPIASKHSIELNVCKDNKNPFYNKNVVFTGTMNSFTRAHAKEIIDNIGGFAQEGVTKETNFLVLGNHDFDTFQNGNLTGKMKKAFEIMSRGIELQIISETDFLQMISLDACGDKMAIEEVYNKIHNIIKKQYKDYTKLERKELKEENAYSITFFEKPALKIKFGSKNYIKLKDKYIPMFKDLPTTKAKSDYDATKVFFQNASDIDFLADALLKMYEDMTVCTFGCCSRHLQCSDARECINPHIEIMMECSYRKKLKQGIIYYGDNRNC